MRYLPKKLLALIAALVALPAIAYALIDSKHLTDWTRYRSVCIELLVVPDTTETTVGTGGVMASTTVNGVAAPSVASTAIPTMPYPATLNVVLIDPTAGSTLACTSATIVGRDQFGRKKSVTTGALSETAAETTVVWAEVTSFSAAGCTGGTAAEDVIRLAVADEIGLGVPIGAASDVETLCLNDNPADATPSQVCSIQDDGTTADIASAVSLARHTIDIDITNLFGAGGSNVTAEDGDGLCFTVRPSGKPEPPAP